jgi:hypothetical protein
MRWLFNFASVGRKALLDGRFAPTALIRSSIIMEHRMATFTSPQIGSFVSKLLSRLLQYKRHL